MVRNSYVFDDTVIGSGCVIDRSIIGTNVTIKDNTHIEKGCLIGDGVIVGPGAHLKAFERLSKKRAGAGKTEDEDEDSDLEEIEGCRPISNTAWR
jgi:translation initiation factor eIF-2B subunit epsilon